MISLVTYAWGLYRQQKEKSTLKKFLEKFESAECALDTTSMPFDNAMYNPLALLAKAFENSGEYHKSINIYLYLIKHINNPIDKGELMESLGQTYLHAGFLERARAIFSEILHKRPRNAKVLYQLGIVYEMMREYDKALSIIEPLQILGEETRELEKFLEFEKIASDKHILPQEKIELSIALLREEPKLYRPIVSLLFKLDITRAWSLMERDSIHSILDILWFLPYSQLDLEIISKDQNLSTIYYAKGYLGEPSCSSGIFTVDLLASSRANGFEDGDLIFSYLCKGCKQTYPIPFSRCPNCLALNTIEVEEDIAKKEAHIENSLL
ncbi:Putative periplasmic protein [hydrothermal vent metagenome]|uniref:Putative periplasmic protein n=1 Tax=hydrothermal vent metagenome TaxID=652676 RepID=A0A1W1BVQ1_9ZZZZ